MSSYLDFRCYFEANGQNHIHFLLIEVIKNSWPDIFSLSDHFPTPNPRLLCFFNVMVAWLWVMFDVDVAHLGLLWIIVSRLDFW